MVKVVRGVLFGILVVLLAWGVTGCSETPQVTSSYWVSECLVELAGYRYEVLVNKQDQRTYFVTDDPVLQDRVVQLAEEDILLDSPVQGTRMFLLYSYPRVPSARFSDPGLDELEGKNMLGAIVPDGFVYSILYGDSLQHIRFLLDSGYTLYASCLTGSYYEVYLCSESGEYLRCAVFPNQLWCAPLYSSGDLPSVLSFMGYWDFNDVLSQLFAV